MSTLIFESIFVGCMVTCIYKQSDDNRKTVNNYTIFQLWGYFCSFQRVWSQPVILVSPLLILWMKFLLKCFVIYVYLYPPIKIPCTVTLVVNSFYKFYCCRYLPRQLWRLQIIRKSDLWKSNSFYLGFPQLCVDVWFL